VSIKLVLKAQRTRVLAATTHYEVLGVAVRAEPADVKLAHRELARLFHPDFSRLEDAHELMAKVNVAYACLSDKDARRAYDSVNRLAEDLCERCEGTGKITKQKGFKAKTWHPCPACQPEK